MIDPLALERDIALDDEAALDRALRIVRVFYLVYGKDNEMTAKYCAELADKLIGVKHNARSRHQAAERKRLELLRDDEILSQLI